jgi:hypothetical protein
MKEVSMRVRLVESSDERGHSELALSFPLISFISERQSP